jgi:hypothetical protein
MAGIRAAALTLLFASACGARAPTQPCAADCGAHGTCAIVEGAPRCLCAASWAGAACADCAAGFVAAGGGCVPDPCQPNPCRGPHQGACTVAAGAPVCSCDADAQDNDHDGTCRPTCAAAETGSGAQSSHATRGAARC